MHNFIRYRLAHSWEERQPPGQRISTSNKGVHILSYGDTPHDQIKGIHDFMDNLIPGVKPSKTVSVIAGDEEPLDLYEENEPLVNKVYGHGRGEEEEETNHLMTHYAPLDNLHEHIRDLATIHGEYAYKKAKALHDSGYSVGPYHDDVIGTPDHEAYLPRLHNFLLYHFPKYVEKLHAQGGKTLDDLENLIHKEGTLKDSNILIDALHLLQHKV
jgi:hypothetical protein